MFINKYTDSNGDLFAKFFLIDSSLNDRKWATTAKANERYAKTAIGTPFTVMHDKKESLFGDYHPFLKGDAPVNEQIDFAYKYAIGQIVDVTKESGRYKAAHGDVDNPWFAIVKITDPQAKEELSKPDSKLMPQAVSPGLIHYDGPDNAITKYHIVHLAAVDRGAYGPRAVKWASCEGDALSCVPTLKSAAKITNKQDFSSLEYYNRHLLNVSEGELLHDPTVYVPILWRANLGASSCDVCERLDGSIFDSVDANRHFPAHDHCKCELIEEITEEDLLGASYISPKIRKHREKRKKAASYKERTNQCPIQTLETLSSLCTKSGSSDNIMSAVNNTSTPEPQSFGSGTMTTSYPSQQQSQQAPAKPTIRIRKKAIGLSEENGQEEQPENNGGQEPQSENTAPGEDKSSPLYSKIQQLEKQVQDNTQRWTQREKQYQLEKVIPRDLFVDSKGRFNQRAWENEIQNAMKETASIELLERYYSALLAARQMPEIQIKGKRASSISLPKGASASSQDDNEDAERRMKLNDLGRMIRGS